MQFSTLLSIAFAGFSLTSAIAIPNVNVDTAALDALKEPAKTETVKVGKTGNGKPGTGTKDDLHHVSTRKLCNPIKDQSKKADCQKELIRCMPKHKDMAQEDACEHKVYEKYKQYGGSMSL